MNKCFAIENQSGEYWLDAWGWMEKDSELISLFSEDDVKQYSLPSGGKWVEV